ncbi:hypothetical protein L3X38_025144 [Prunus dulcis]|uniref:Uncharacterized protein n=1 Tax=Prunus dulcis TaxID=3755 RepID=A0AAD4W3P2_PRUDU|nr:hypothetical protein L3X38_025144 [Prunus dulcis]
MDFSGDQRCRCTSLSLHRSATGHSHGGGWVAGWVGLWVLKGWEEEEGVLWVVMGKEKFLGVLRKPLQTPTPQPVVDSQNFISDFPSSISVGRSNESTIDPSSSPTPPQSSPSQSPSADDTPLVPSPASSNLSDVNHINLNADGRETFVQINMYYFTFSL